MDYLEKMNVLMNEEKARSDFNDLLNAGNRFFIILTFAGLCPKSDRVMRPKNLS